MGIAFFKTIRILLIPVFLVALFLQTAWAQYSFDALRMATQVPGQDAQSMAQASSSVAGLQGFGSFLINPATAGLIQESYFSAGIGMREVSQNTTYLGTATSFDDQQAGITHVGFAYRVPTVVGSLALGGGYSQTADYNQAHTISAFNDFTSRTYQFLTDYTQDIAFNTFAIDEANGMLESVFEYGGFQGVNQFAETRRRGQSAEYQIFLATEFQKNFFIGLSLGIPVSQSVFQQVFIESDPRDGGKPLYSGEAGTGSYNVDRMLFEERIRVNAVGLNSRIGFVFTGLPMLQVGGSYSTSTRWNVEERFDAFIQTHFDDVVTLDGTVLTDGQGNTYGPVMSDRLDGEYSYKLTTPARMMAGVSTRDLPFARLYASVGRIAYSRIRFRDFDVQDREVQINENKFVSESFSDVWNIRAGAAITLFDQVEPRFGWAMMDNPVSYLDDNIRQFLSFGLGIGLNQSMSLDFALQYGFWNTEDDLYYVDQATGIITDGQTGAPITFIETAEQEVSRLHAAIGLSIRF